VRDGALVSQRLSVAPPPPTRPARAGAEAPPAPGGVCVLLRGEDVTEAIREPEISAAASRVSVHPQVREAMVERQRALIERGDYVAEGRDIGTVVSPDAPLKVFLNADPVERARRRAAESGEPQEDVLAAQRERDARDRTREHGALLAAPDAVELDTTGLAVGEVVARIAELATARGLR
jgi:cytidylate kinase